MGTRQIVKTEDPQCVVYHKLVYYYMPHLYEVCSVTSLSHLESGPSVVLLDSGHLIILLASNSSNISNS